MIGSALGRDLNVVEEAILAIAVDPPRRTPTAPAAQRRCVDLAAPARATCPPSCARHAAPVGLLSPRPN